MVKFKAQLTDGEMSFMELWSDIIKKKYSIPSNKLDEAANYIGYKRSGSCSTCLHNDAIEMNNIYMRLFEEYNVQLELNKSLKLLENIDNKENNKIEKKNEIKK